MEKENHNPNREMEILATGLADVFIRRRDLYPRQYDDGRYMCIRQPLTQALLMAHLKGELTLGTYVLDETSKARFLVFDGDDDEQFSRLRFMAGRLAAQGITSYLEQSRRGGHLWLFFARPVGGRHVRRFGQGLATTFGLQEVELFPKQSVLKDGPGSLIRLPFGVHRRTGQRYTFITPDGKPLAPSTKEQIQMLSKPQTISKAIFDAYSTLQAIALQTPEKPVFEAKEVPSGTLSEQIKASISVQAFVGQFVQLSSNGRGLCPFHDDQQQSFSVNAERNYWHCFSGCGGGSIIDFWMKKQNCDFRTAVRELAGMLLK